MYPFFVVIAAGSRSDDSGHGGFDVHTTFSFGLKQEFGAGDGDEDDAGRGVESHVSTGIEVDVFPGGVHPAAEEDCCW